MKSRIYNPFRSGISAVLSVLTLGCFAAPSTQAASIYWDGTSASWNLNTNWSTVSGADTPDPVAVPSAADDAIFNITTVNGAQTITLGANQAVNSMTFNNTGTTAITGGGTARTLSLGAGGITMASGAGAVTLGSGAAGNNVLLNLSGAQTWTNHTANAFTINNTAATFTRQTGATLTFNKASTGNFAISTTAAPLVNTIIGPWAFFGTGANQRYANITSGNVTGLTGTSTGGLSVTGATTNYEVTGANLTLGGGNYSSNTIRYAGTGHSFNFYNSSSGGSRHTTNGILAVGASGVLELRRSNATGDARLIIGSSGELVVAGQQAVTISVPIAEGAAGRGLTYSGTNTLILSGVNTYTGATTVSSGTLRLSNSLALQNSPLNTSGSIVGDASNGLKTTVTTLTLGGLTGDKDLTSLFTTTSGGYDSVTALTLNTGSSASHSYSGVIANGAANMSLTKTGAGTQTLSGSNTYTGATTLSAGTLILNNATALGGNNPGVNGTISISMGANSTLQSNYAPADAGITDSYVHAPITLTAAGTNNFFIGAGSSTNPAESVRFNLNGAIGGSAGANVVFGNTTAPRNNANSIIVLGAASTYDGNTTIQAGNTANRINVIAGVANALPTTTVLSFDNMAGTGTGRLSQYDLNGNDQTLAGLDNGGNVPQLRNHSVTNSGALATLTINNSADFTFGGAYLNTANSATTRAQITGNIALVKDGSGIFTLGGTLTNGATDGGHTYTGTTTVAAGKLVVNSNISTSLLTTVQTGATLGGSGTVGALTIDLGGTLAPGNSPGIITVVGDYTQNGTLSLELNGTTPGSLHDQVSVTGSVTLNGLLSATVGYTPVLNDMLFILLNDGGDDINGTFTGLAQGDTVSLGGYDWQISYTADSTGGTFLGGNDVALMAVPEPRTALLGGLGLLALLRRRRN